MSVYVAVTIPAFAPCGEVKMHGVALGIAVPKVIVYVPDDDETVAVAAPKLLVTVVPPVCPAVTNPVAQIFFPYVVATLVPPICKVDEALIVGAVSVPVNVGDARSE